MLSTGIIIQARTGSTRMPEKVILPFFGNKSLIDLILEKMKKTGKPVVLATTTNLSDNRLCLIAKKHGVKIFRGSENDVLDRFTLAAQQFGFTKIIRVCADNPFLDFNSLIQLISQFEESDADYLSFNLAGNRPSILTHFGFWAEAVTLAALEKTRQLTKEKLYIEHVTNFIYKHPDLFKVNFIDAPEIVFSRNDIRLTLDTFEDFKIQSDIYAQISNEKPNFGIPEIIKWLDSKPQILEIMKKEIKSNQK